MPVSLTATPVSPSTGSTFPGAAIYPSATLFAGLGLTATTATRGTLTATTSVRGTLTFPAAP